MRHNMLIEPLPVTVQIGEEFYAINSDFRVTIAFEILMQDPDIEDAQKAKKALELYYPIIPHDLDAAVDQIMWFYQGGKKYRQEQARRSGALDPDDTQRIYSFEHDDDYIYAAFLSQYHIDLQKVPYMHWWKFRAMFHSLRSDMKISEIMGYRSMEINEKMTPEQRDYYQKMKNLYALPMPADEVEKADAIAAALMNGGDLSGIL